jgi:hypothetical protein
MVAEAACAVFENKGKKTWDIVRPYRPTTNHLVMTADKPPPADRDLVDKAISMPNTSKTIPQTEITMYPVKCPCSSREYAGAPLLISPLETASTNRKIYTYIA